MTAYRTERDSLGELQVPEQALYGAQTQRAIENFPISGLPLPAAFIDAVVTIKKSAALAHSELELMPEAIAEAIVAACDSALSGAHRDQFPVDVFQTGSGTSTNMNVNEVIAHLAARGSGQDVHPNDHVNMGQSSNDVIPSAIHISAALVLENRLLPALEHLIKTIDDKAAGLATFTKTGRTHLMDAMPVRFDQVLEGWSTQLKLHIQSLRSHLPALLQLAQGGTAVGTGVNAHPQFADHFYAHLNAETGLTFSPSPSFFANIGGQDAAVSISGQLKALATCLIKISNDLRWMNSGPIAGICEIELPTLQPGSSIMPGKVNPVIPEATVMAGFQVIGNDTAISLGAQSGNFELNVSLPLIAHNLLQSLELLSNCSRLLADKAISGFEVREDELKKALNRNPVLVTALNPIIGYSKAAEIAKKAYKEQRPILEVALEETDIAKDELESLLDPTRLTHGGLPG